MRYNKMLTTILLIFNIYCFSEAQEKMTIIVRTGERQTFKGFGFGLNGPEINTVPKSENREVLHKMLFEDLNTKIVRLWYRDRAWIPEDKFISDYVPGIVNTCRDNGVKTLLFAPGSIYNNLVSRDFVRVSKFIHRLKTEYNIEINVSGTQNEPSEDMTSDVLRDTIDEYKNALDSLGLNRIDIVAPEAASANGTYFHIMSEIKSKYPDTWNKIKGISSHSYNMGARNDWAEIASDKEYWITEAGGGEGRTGVGAPARFFNDMNHNVTHWCWYKGADARFTNSVATIENSHSLILLEVDGEITINDTYWYIKQMLSTFDVGAIFRKPVSDVAMPTTDMTWTYGQKPAIIASAAKNPDGTWGIGLTNISGIYSSSDHCNYYPAESWSVTVKIEELEQEGNMNFEVYRTTKDLSDNNKYIQTVTMKDGKLIWTINPGELVTFRSINAPTDLSDIKSGRDKCLRVYPNPLDNSNLIIESNEVELGTLLNVKNLKGDEIFQTNIVKNITILDRDIFSANGIYIVSLIQKSGTYIEKVIVL